MNDEIKEFNEEKYVEMLENGTLYDYITNLQEKVDQYENPDNMTLMFMWCDEKAKDKIKQLQEENERLKENAIHNDKVVDKAKWNEMLYKSRNEKAIEYFKYQLEQLDFYEDTKAKMLCAMGIVILQGEDKE